MKKLVQNPVFRMLSDLRLAAVVLTIFAIAAGAATLIESYYTGTGSTTTGRSAAYEMVYDAPWFNALLVLLFVNLLLNLVRRLEKGRQPLGFLLVHVGMLVILLGAGVTRWYGFEGYLRIREGQSNNVVSSAKEYAVVRQGDHEASFALRLYRAGHQNKSRTVDLGGAKVTLGVAEYWPRFERALVPGAGGIARVTLGVMGGTGGPRMHTLEQGDDARIGSVTVHFHRHDLPPATSGETGRYGSLRVRVGDEVGSFSVAPTPGDLGELSGWSFELTEFQTDYRTGSKSDPEGPMLNPMVRVVVTSPQNETAEKILFALHPDFGLMHDEADLLSQVDLVYEVSSGGVDLARQGDQVVMRAPFPLEVANMSTEGETRNVAAGEVVPLERQLIYRGEGGFQVVASEVETSLVPMPTLSENPNSPDAARLYVEKNGQRAEAICVKGGSPQPVDLAGEVFALSYGSIQVTLPYNLFLEDFVLETHPGSDNPAGYESHVQLNDPEQGIEGRPVRIWMNNPLNHRGTKHFQSSYDRDRKGTVLSINRDPGKTPTYLGYAIISLGFLVVIGRILIDRGRAGNAAVAAGLVLLAASTLVLPGAVQAQHSSHAQQAPPMISLSPDAQDAAASLIVQDFRGRMKPLDTLARETAIKITKKTTFAGRDPVEVFLGYVVHSSAWYHYPCIAVKNPGVQDLLGVSRATHHVSLGSLLDGGTYKLQEVVDEAHRTPASKRNKTQQKLILFDERVHILYGALQGTSLRIFPLPDDPGNTWQSIDKVLESMPEGDPHRAEFQAAADALIGGLTANDDARIREGLRLTAALQQTYGADVMPAGFRIAAEKNLNSLRPFVRSMLPYLAGFALLIVAYFVGLFRHDGKLWTWRSPLFALGMLTYFAGFALHLYGFVLRWIASGRAPLSNGHESLLFVALAVALAGLIFELLSRTAAAGALGALLTTVVLGVSMMGTFDPAIGPLVPVLASYWLNIHVTIITASYGFLGLSCLLGLLTLVLYIVNWGGKRTSINAAVHKLDKLNVDVMLAGLGLLSIGTLLGGVWANESWGRYWGWDPKETWALVSILVYAAILHLRWIPRLATPYVQATGAFLAIWAVVMTYFGVNYLLVGLHSYAAGDAATIPTWVILACAGSVALCLVAFFAWGDSGGRRRSPASA